MTRRISLLTALAITLSATTVATTAEERHPDGNPFALVNVVDLFVFFSSPVTLDTNDPNFPNFNPTAGPPPNYAQYLADPRLGTNPASVAVDGDRAWIGGFHNGVNFSANPEVAWYNSLGIGEVQNILSTSGFDGSLTNYDDAFIFGPGISNTENFSGLDYDPLNRILYATFDDAVQLLGVPTGADSHEESYVVAIDADPNSPTYGQELWKFADPINPPTNPFESGDRFFGGLAVDPLNPQWLYVAQNGGPTSGEFGFRVFDTLNPFAFDPDDPTTSVNVKDIDSVCSSTFYRSMAFDAVTGDLFTRPTGAIEWIPRDPAQARFAPLSRTIEEPAGGNTQADTLASGDDEQLVAVGATVAAGDDIIGAGPNGVLDTLPAGDDIPSPTQIMSMRPAGNQDLPNDDGACNDDPVHGFGNSIFQAQNLAIVSASNLLELNDDIVLGNERVIAGGGNEPDVRLFKLDGTYIGNLVLPGATSPSEPGAPSSAGLGLFDLDYDEASGTLVVVNSERRWLYVYKAQTDGGDPYPRYDYTRNGSSDLADFAGLQINFTGEQTCFDVNGELRPLGLASLRLHTDTDCDIDFADFETFAAYWDQFGGPR
jgi:hypothetical protein